MNRVLLISEQFLRENFDISDSISSKTAVTAIKEAQDFYLASVIGDKFIKELYYEVENHVLTDVNKYFLDTYIQPFLGAQTVQIITSKISFKVGNQGVTKSQDATDPKQLVDYYTNLTGIALRRLTDYLAHHYGDYAQWLNGFEGIKPHVSASTETNIYLGGTTLIKKYPVDTGWRR